LAGVLITLLMLILGGIIGGLVYLDQTFQGKVYPNVSVQGIDVSNQTPQEIEQTLRQRYSTFVQQPIELSYNGQTWRPTLAELGGRFDFATSANQAYQSGRQNGLIGNLQQVAAIWQTGLDLPIKVEFDQNAMRNYVRKVTASLEQPPVDAQLVRDGVQVYTTAARNGRQVLVDETVQSLTESLYTLEPQKVVVRTRELAPRLFDAETNAAQQQIQQMLQAPIIMKIGDREIVWEIEDLTNMIDTARVEQESGRDQISVAINRYQIERRLKVIAAESKFDGTRPRVAWNDGSLRIITPGKSGIRLDESAAFELITKAFTSNERSIVLPLEDIGPPITEANLNTLGIQELVSVGRSDFSGSAPYRIHNIGAGMELLNGLLIAPGEEFSFNENIGQINAANGFVEGYAIIQNRTQLEFGGGICQDSTTLFRAAFWAGLPITERWGHSFYISWYDRYSLGSYGNGPGMDATIFTGGPDLKFVNDTGNWLLMQAWSNPSSGIAQIEFYGTKLNRTVELSRRIYDEKPAIAEPVFVADPKQPRGFVKQTDTARGGMSIDVFRVITTNGVRGEPELFRTVFKAWPNIFAVNPADFGPDGKPINNVLPPHMRQPEPPPPEPTPDPNAPPPDPSQPAPDPGQPAPTPDPGQPAPPTG
jgi:vancomycin resistance protein YoaR